MWRHPLRQPLLTRTAAALARRLKCSISGNILSTSGTGGFDLTFLGTSSQGGARRYPSSLALRLRGAASSQVWLFDAGEGATAQLQRSNMRMGLVRNIFITHLHGDHLFGLPGLVMCILGRRDELTNTNSNSARSPFIFKNCPSVANFRVPSSDALHIHELIWPQGCGAPAQRGRHRLARPYWRCPVRALPFEGEGRNIVAKRTDDGQSWVYNLIDDNDAAARTSSTVEATRKGEVDGDMSSRPATVVASPVLHTVPTYAFGVTERVTRRRFDKDKLDALGIPSDGRGEVRELFSRWLSGEHGMWRGREIPVHEVVAHGRAPRRLCVVGDTNDASMARHIARGADVLVHEATNVAAQSDLARQRGHSSTLGATAFAKRVGAKRLILNHTSVAYSERKIRAMEAEARVMFGSRKVFVARDLSVFSVPTMEEDEEDFVFRRFVGFADSLEYRTQIGAAPFGGDFAIDEDDKAEGDMNDDQWTGCVAEEDEEEEKESTEGDRDLEEVKMSKGGEDCRDRKVRQDETAQFEPFRL